jgi:hypothetical protein
MMEKDQTRREAIKDAAGQYAANRWRSLRPELPLLFFALAAVGFSLTGTALGRLNQPGARTWHLVLLLVANVCWLAVMAIIVRRFTGGRKSLKVLQNSGEPATTFPRLKWWFWPLAFLVYAGIIFGLMWLWLRFPINSPLPSRALMYLMVALTMSGGALWMMRLLLRGDWRGFVRERSLRVQREAGVVVEEPVPVKLKWWFLPFAVFVAPLCVLSILALSNESPMRWQLLIFAAGVTLFGLVVRSLKDKQVRSAWKPVHFLPWALYCLYAVAVAAGLPQPFANAPWEGASRVVRLTAPLALFTLIGIGAAEIYSRRQLHRLQNLLKEVPEGGQPDAGD